MQNNNKKLASRRASVSSVCMFFSCQHYPNSPEENGLKLQEMYELNELYQSENGCKAICITNPVWKEKKNISFFFPQQFFMAASG